MTNTNKEADKQPPKVSKAQLDIMKHTLGLNYKSEPYRNYYCSGEDCDGHSDLLALCDMGLMCKRDAPNWTGVGDVYFHVTKKGYDFLGISMTSEAEWNFKYCPYCGKEITIPKPDDSVEGL